MKRNLHRANVDGSLETWTNSNAVDSDGEGAPPGVLTDYSVMPLPDRGAKSPKDVFGPSIVYHFDADITSGMNFATGDATSGGTVDSWTDLTGQVAANVTISGDSPVTYTPNARKGKGAIHGDGSTQSIETGNIVHGGGVGDHRLWWAVVQYRSTGSTQACYDFGGLNAGPRLVSAFNNDLISGKNHICLYAQGNSAGQYIPATIQPADEEVSICIWRQAVGSTDSTFETWHRGLKIAEGTTTNATLRVGTMFTSFGAAGSLIRSDGYVFEAGAVSRVGGTISDAEVEQLTRHLCEKYGVSFMPDTTPMDIGLIARSTDSAIAQTDTCLWYRSDEGLTGSEWPLHPDCAQFHTTPANFTIRVNNSGSHTLQADDGRKNVITDEVNDWIADNGYSSTETVDFPAAPDGITSLTVAYHDPATTQSSGGQLGTSISFSSFLGTSDAVVQHLASNSSSSWTTAGGKWVMIGASYRWDTDTSGGIGEPGTPDGTPGHWKFLNDEPILAVNAGAALTANLRPFIGGNGSGSLLGVTRCREIICLKHPIVQSELDNLKRYLKERYPGMGLTP